MRAAPVPENELSRLNALMDLNVLDTTAEVEFDALVQAAALVCNVPISLISLIDSKRQWFKANIGLPGATETPRDMAFCAYAIHEDDILEVEDATKDPRFIDNPLVTSKPNIRFYAGATLRLSNGAHVGTLCVIDNKPHHLDERQRAVLRHLAAVAVKALESRRALLNERTSSKHLSELSSLLIASEARFRALSDASPLGIFATDLNGNCTYTNSRWQEIYGLTLAESQGQGWKDGLYPDDTENVFETWSIHAPLGIEFDMEFRTQHKNGDIRIVHARARPIKCTDNEITGFVGSVEDITPRKKAEAERMQEQQYLASIIEGTGAGTWQWNVQTGQTRFNEQWAIILGYSLSELSPVSVNTWLELTHPDDVEHANKLLQQHFCGEIPTYECEFRMRNCYGSWVWILARGRVLSWASNGNPEWMFGTHIDISLRKQQQEALRKSQLLLDRTGRIAGVGGWEVNLNTHKIYWTDETCRIHGVAPGYQPTLDEAINFYAPEGRPIIQAAVENALQTGEGWDLELPFIQADGEPIWVRAVGSVEFDGDKPSKFIGAFQNITEKVNQRLAIEKAHDRASLATDSGEIGIWEYDLVHSTIEWDAWMYRLYGLTPVMQTSPYDLWVNNLHPDDKIRIESAVEDAINGIRAFDTEFRIVWSDGSTHHIRATARVTRDEQGKALKMVGVNWDVSRISRLSRELAEQHELLRVTLQSIGDSVITTNAQGEVTWLNPAAERMTGWSTKEALGRPLSQVFHIVNEDSRLQAENPVATCLEQGKIVELANHTLLISRNGDEFGIEDSAAPIRNEQNELLGVVLVFHDVTEQRRLSGEISYQATHDALTGLLNRTEFETRLRHLLHKTHEDKSQHAVMYIDLDQFKIVNDSCGHTAGDQLLQQVSQLLSKTVRSRDTLARLGGDEFGIILEHCSTDQAQRVAQQICEKMEDFRFHIDERRFRIGTSIGLVAMDNRWPTTAALMQAADTSCYAAKEAGRNRVHTWFDTDISMHARHGQMQWATRIEQALDENQFELYAQRIESLTEPSQKLHAEVLLRMIDVDGTIVLPGAFLPAAERFNLASRIDRWVLRRAIDWLLTSPENSNCVDMLAINLSGQSIGDRAFHRHAIEMLSEAGEKICGKICLEITETAAITNLADASLFIEQVSNLGIRIALDDFGAGASSFGYLKNLAVDILKIDGQFIRDLIDDPLDDAAVRCFVDVAKLLNIKTVAEFVDKPEILARIHEIGIDYAQGFLLHKPEPIDTALCSSHVTSQS